MISKSSGKTTKVSNADDVEIKYGHIIQVLTDWIDTNIQFLCFLILTHYPCIY